jgi:NADH-quinone oxidoreductase subunit E
MSVRRLDPVQPASFAFTPENLAWAKICIAKYPAGKQASAVIPLLWRGQEQEGWTSRPMIEYVAEMLDMAYIRVLEVATFYTMFQLSPVGKKAHIQLCGTIACQLRGAEELREVCERKIHPQAHHLNADGSMSWEEVECLGSCVNAPMVQVFKDTYEDLTPAKLEELIDLWQAGQQVKPGPQIDRQYSMAEGGASSLTDKSLYKGQRSFRRVEAPPPPAPVAPAVAAAVAPMPATKDPIPSPASVKPAASDIPPVTLVSKQAEAQKQSVIAKEAASTAPGVVMTEKAQAETGIVRVTKDAVVKSTAKINAKSKPAAERIIDPPKPAIKSAARAIDGRPELLKKPHGKADDLKLIWGVGPALEKLLNKIGIWHFDQIANWSAKELVWVDEKLEGFKGRAKRDEWIKQSKKLAKGWRPDNAVGEKPGRK